MAALPQKPPEVSARPWISSGGDVSPAPTLPFTRGSTRVLSAELYEHMREAFGLEGSTPGPVSKEAAA